MTNNRNQGRTNRSGHTSSRLDLGGWGLSAILRDIAISWQLMFDREVSFLMKLCLPLFAVLYWISPIDLLPTLPFDDIAVVVFATRVFVQMAPRAAVMRALARMGYQTVPSATRNPAGQNGRSSSSSDRDDYAQPDREIWDIWTDEEWNDETDGQTISGEWRVVDDAADDESGSR